MDLKKLLPPVYNDINTMKELQDIISYDVNRIASRFEETIDQCFVGTATDLLSRYEKIHGLSVDVTKSDTFRRERIIAKAKGTGTITKKMLEDVAKSYSNGDVEVIENFEDCSFIVKFIGTRGIPANMADLTITIDEIKPAHLSYTFEYTYRRYEELTTYTHEQLSAYTHQTIREGVI